VLGDGDTEVAKETVTPGNHQGNVEVPADLAELQNALFWELGGDHDGELGEDVRVLLNQHPGILRGEGGRKKRGETRAGKGGLGKETNLLNKASIDILVEFLEQLSGDTSPGQPNGGSLQEEVAAGISPVSDLAVNDGEGAKARQHKVLEDLSAHSAGIDETHLGGLERRLTMLTPQTVPIRKETNRKKKKKGQKTEIWRLGSTPNPSWNPSLSLVGMEGEGRIFTLHYPLHSWHCRQQELSLFSFFVLVLFPYSPRRFFSSSSSSLRSFLFCGQPLLAVEEP